MATIHAQILLAVLDLRMDGGHRLCATGHGSESPRPGRIEQFDDELQGEFS